LLLLAEKLGGWGGLGDRPASPSSRCFLVAGKLACSAADGSPSTRRARDRKFLEEISDADISRC
jgi:hypothetical protein